MNNVRIGIAGLLLLPVLLSAQQESDETGFEAGNFHVRPSVEASVSHDNRVFNDDVKAFSDSYTESRVKVLVNNLPARFDLAGRAVYGYRSYDEFDFLNDEFYEAGVSVASRKDFLKLGISSFVKKTLEYDSTIESAGLQEPSVVLIDDASVRVSSRIDVGYEKQLNSKTAVMPLYEGWYYSQTFDDAPGKEDVEWHEHRVGLQLGYGSPNQPTTLTLSGYYNMQFADEETGRIASVLAGAKSRATAKTFWEAQLGIAVAEYENSGSDQSLISRMQLQWSPTKKVSAYVSGGNSFIPGYWGSDARLAYRLGYGIRWDMLSRWSIAVSMLHDYQDSINRSEAPSSDELDQLRHFITGRIDYRVTRNISIDLTGKYVNDEEEKDQTVTSLGLIFRY